MLRHHAPQEISPLVYMPECKFRIFRSKAQAAQVLTVWVRYPTNLQNIVIHCLAMVDMAFAQVLNGLA